MLNLFFPKVCEACHGILKDNEVLICISCRHQLPVTNFHFENSDRVKKILYGRVQLECATALLYFSKKSIVQELLHNLKYRNHEDISTFFGEWLGAELKEVKAYKAIDVVVPVPLFKTKLRKRGYNQVAEFGKAIAKALGIDYNDTVLIKIKPTKTKVFAGRTGRYNDNAVFGLSNTTVLSGKHILLVDDIITTGSTVEACANELLKINNIKLSLATMAIVD
ncbi:phosphoribosyltransferase family protein [uncultured Winogradskyella sp.]|uniref:ComF family protein n=1 Tax=uncultured Winogradskyella sp. TaxID=395353 RepID=UPI003450F954